MSLTDNGQLTLLDSSKNNRFETFVIVAAIIIFALAPAAVLFESYGPGAVPLIATGTELEVRDTFHPVSIRYSDINLSTLRVVDLREEPQLRPAHRISGVSARSYRLGRFRLENGEEAMVCLARETHVLSFWDRALNVRVLIGSTSPEQMIAVIRNHINREH